MARKRKIEPFQWGIFSPKALKVIDTSLKRLNMFSGSIRSGKTINCNVMFIDHSLKKKLQNKFIVPGRGIIAGKTIDAIKRNIGSDLEAMTGGAFKPVYGNHEATFCGRQIDLIGANDAKAENKIRGTTYAFAYVDEITILPESFVKMLLGRLSVEGAWLIATMNPDNPHHWLKEQYLDNPELQDQLAHWTFNLDDNPNLGKQYIEDLKREYTGVWYDRYILGRWVAAEGRVWEAFDEHVHVINKMPIMIRPQNFAAMDYGTTNATVVLDIYDDDNFTVVHDSWRWDSHKKGRQLTDEQQARDIKEWYSSRRPPAKVLIDPAAASMKLAMKAQGFHCVDANNDVSDGLRKVNTLFNRKTLLIMDTPNNRDLVKEIAEYSWDKKASDRGVEQPIKQHDHGCDALRYYVNSLKDRRFKYVT